MYTRILFGLLVSAFIFAACKKDKTPSHLIFKGIVLNRETNKPVADAWVILNFTYVIGLPHIFRSPDSAKTNANGQYEFSIPYQANLQQYYLQFQKDSLQQASYNKDHIARGIDTILVERPSYIHLTVKITRPLTDSVVLEMHNFDDMKHYDMYFGPSVYQVLKQAGTYTFLSQPFSTTLFPKARAVLYRSHPNNQFEIITDTVINPSAYTTTHFEMEY